MKIKHAYEEILAIVENKNGKLLTIKTNYNKLSDKINIKCENDHQWNVKAQSILDGYWCRQCYALKRTTSSIIYAKELAISRGGLCLSLICKNSHSLLKWQCINNHIWEAKYYSVKNGRWCSECNSSFSEKLCRYYLEKIFNLPFYKFKPKWLINSRGNQMELDGYCEKLSLAFEHNGIQHYKENKKFNSDLNLRIQDDNEKIKLCKENDIKLIVIPALVDILKIKDLKKYLITSLTNLEIKIPEDLENLEINLNEIYYYDNNKESNKLFKQEKFKKIQEKVKIQNGILLSNEYIDYETKLKLQCVNNHQWSALPHSILRGSWCKKCFNEKLKLNLSDFIKIAELYKGKCLSDKYINSNHKLEFECENKHIWKASSKNIKNGSWCPKCRHKKKEKYEN